jgi:predicted metal-dependent hydrolase
VSRTTSDRSLPVEVRVSARARRLRLRVLPGGRVEVVVPPRTPRRAVEALLREHGGWIERQRERLRPRLGLDRLGLTERDGRRLARERVESVARVEARRLGLVYGRIRIADQRTRWGSCSGRGTLSFNWRLAVAPPEVLEYVVVHELCHLRHPNHSRAFWEAVEAARPGYDAERRWLREHGAELQAYVPR